MPHNRRASAMIEVLVAIVMLSTAGTSLTLLLGQTEHTMRAVREAERRERIASNELERLVGLDRAAFLRLDGESTRNGFHMLVVERAPGLFDVALSSSHTTPPILSTTFYRPDSTHDAP